jgi:formylmethanofuran dehydrogenase subunit E
MKRENLSNWYGEAQSGFSNNQMSGEQSAGQEDQPNCGLCGEKIGPYDMVKYQAGKAVCVYCLEEMYGQPSRRPQP